MHHAMPSSNQPHAATETRAKFPVRQHPWVYRDGGSDADDGDKFNHSISGGK